MNLRKRIFYLTAVAITVLLLLGAGLPGTSATASDLEDTIAVTKTAERVDGCRAYQVTLGITGTPPPEKPVDVILVIDRSGSMKDGNAMVHAKNAAKDFAQTVLQENSNNRVAVISFSYFGHLRGGAPGGTQLPQNQWAQGNLDRDTTIHSGFSNNLGTVKSAINGLSADGGTNSEAGFVRAEKLMKGEETWYDGGRDDAVKAIVFLTDGIPTVSIGNNYGPDNEPTSETAHTKAAWQAGEACWPCASVFTINLLAGVPNKCLNLARATMKAAQDSGYYETPSADELQEIYGKIAQVINYSAKNAVVTDKIPTDQFEFVEFVGTSQGEAPGYNSTTGTITWNAGTIGTEAALSYKIKALDSFNGGTDVPTNVAATLTYTDIYGNSNQTKTFDVPTVTVPGPLTVNAGPDREISLGSSINIGENLSVTGGDEPYSYLWTGSGWSSTEINPTRTPEVKTTYTVKVKDKYGCEKSASFTVTPVPKGAITVNKVVQRGSTSKKFAIYVKGNDQTWSMRLSDGQSATIDGLAPGNYTIYEVVPMGYRLVSISESTVTIAPNALERTVTVTNKKVRESWFRDDKEKTNTFKVKTSF